MSFSFEFIAKNKADATAILVTQHCPDDVAAFIMRGIAGLSGESADKLVSVRANGHLASGSDYEISTATIDVRWLTVAKPPEPAVVEEPPPAPAPTPVPAAAEAAPAEQPAPEPVAGPVA
jgi:hypothetical protein